MNTQPERLYYNDSYLTSFRAKVVEGGSRVVLDRTAFYPTSGGQPCDSGRIGGHAVREVVDEDGRIVHVLAESESVPAGDADCEIDWTRRFDHMQQHTGQHLLSAVFHELYEIATVSFHMGASASTIDLVCSSLSARQIAEVEARANAIVQENRQVLVTFEEASEAGALRKASEREGVLRVVSIENLDRSACGGTHVRSTGEIGAILLRSTEKVRGNLRLDFLCGGRAIRRARSDYSALESVARSFSASLDEVPALVAAQTERLKDSEKARRKLENELAEYRGRALHAGIEPNRQGLKIHSRILPAGPFPDELRVEANSFLSGGRAIFVALSELPAALLVGASPDSGVHAGNLLRKLFQEGGGKGGGSAQMAQGSFTSDANTMLGNLERLLSAVERSD